MRYRNKRTGTIAEPSAEAAALNFAHNSDWEEITETVNAETDSPDETKIPEDEGEEETPCSPSEQTATSQSDTPMNTSENTTEQEAPNENGGKTSAKKKGKAPSKLPAES